MSQFRIQQPIEHIPSFTKWGVQRYHLIRTLNGLGIKAFPEGVALDAWYYFTDLEGWGKVLQNLVFNSNLYKKDIFDCEDYALKAQVVCAERYGLNALRLCIGDVPRGKHGFNLFFYGDRVGIKGGMLFEPNEGYPFSGSAFEIGDYGYKPEIVLI